MICQGYKILLESIIIEELITEMVELDFIVMED